MSAAAPYTTRLAIPAVATYQQLRIAAGLSAKTAEAAAKGLPNSLFAVQVLLGDDGALYWIARDASGGVTRYDTEPGASVWKRIGVAILSVLPIDWLL
ncbi:MAG: hypothetical protein RSH52_27990 [Janthinobacterium sp.]